jgi:hypothetical protein
MATAKGNRTALKFGIEDFKTYFYDSINELLKTEPIPPAITTYLTEITDVLNRAVRKKENILLVEKLKNRSLVFLIVLLRLADVKKSFSSLKTQIDNADNIFDGIFELAKNVVEHSSTRRGSLTITSITENVIKQMAGEVKPSNAQKLKKGNGWRRNPALWASYYSYVTKSQLQFFHKNNKYLDISIADTGTVGIIESAIKELNDKIEYFKTNSTVQGLCREDIETITNLIRSGDDEAKLLYDLYFNRSGKGIDLNTQSRNAYRGLGIYLFTKFVNAHYGIFNTQTNKYLEQSSTINFASFDGAYQRSNFESPEIFGTRYNIIIPILYESNETRESDSEGTNANAEGKLVLSKGVYEKMLPLSNHFITKDEESRYFLGGLSKYKLFKYVIRHNFGKDNEALVLSLGTKIFRGEDGELLLPIDRTKIFRAVSQLFDGNGSIKTIIIKDISAELTKGLVEIYSDFVFSDNEECLLFKDRLIMFIVEDKQMDSIIEGHQVAIVTGDCIESCKKINQYVSEKNRDVKCFPAMCRPYSERERTKIETMLDRHHLFDKGQIIALDYFEKGAAHFEIKARQKLEKSIEDDGYNWKTTHLKIGSKLHLNDFVYGKKMFQQSKEVSAFAFDLARHIFYRNINRISREDKQKKQYIP